MIGRRSLLRMIGAAPLVAANPTKALEAAGIGTTGLGSMVSAASISTLPGGDYQAEEAKSAAYLLAQGIPGFVKEALRRDRRVPQGLDPDLAVNRSFSLAAKVAIQRERNFQRACEDTIGQQRTLLARNAMRKTLGFDFWW